MLVFDDCLIMAGGSGTRLWPASRCGKPKQFLPITYKETESFFSKSLERAFRVICKKKGKVIVIAGKSQLPLVIESCAKLSNEEKKYLVLIGEPEAKNTAPAIVCAIKYSQKTCGNNRSMLVLTSDHIIKPIDVFLKEAQTAAHFAGKNYLVLFGITPSRPETGYGYIEAAEELADGVYRVGTFREKPDQKTAEEFFAGKRHFWNSGMFAFTCEFLQTEFHQQAADIFNPFEQLKAPDEKSYTEIQGLRILSDWAGLDHAYRAVKNISFDKAIAERCMQALMLRASFDWIDIGSWDDYASLLSEQAAGNTLSEVYTCETGDSCFIDSDIPVALAGVKDIIVVIRSGKDGSPPAALIVKKGETQRVRDIVEQIKQADRTEIL